MSLQYLSGFGNEFATEAVAGALPAGQNSPQKAPHGLYAELISGTSFLAPRAQNRRTWMYRLRPSARLAPFTPYSAPDWKTPPLEEVPTPPDRLRWNPFALPVAPTDFVDGVLTLATNGDCAMQTGIGVHVYNANRSMQTRYFCNNDAEMLLVPQSGRLRLVTELGTLEVAPNEIAVLPRGIRCRVELPDDAASGYIAENYGPHLRLPELGPLGSNGLANPRDFLSPVAAYEDQVGALGDFELIAKFGGRLWRAPLDRSPLDVAAWHGNLSPYKYDLANFMVVGSISFDHPDPSIFTVLTSPSDTPGWANLDFVIFPPRWLVAEHTFRPPWYHRNVMSEFMGLVSGQYDARAKGFVPGGSSLHNSFAPHGPDASTYQKASTAPLAPQKLDATMAFMFETRYLLKPTKRALECGELQHDYHEVWDTLSVDFKKP